MLSLLLLGPLAAAAPVHDATAPRIEPSVVLMVRQTIPVGEYDAEGDLKPPSAEIYNARLGLVGTADPVRAVLEVRFRQSPLRSFSPSNLWLQQGYVEVTPAPGIRWQAGLLYKALGVSWDGSWFGNAPYLNAHKLDPDLGFAQAGDLAVSEGVHLSWEAQFFVQEDGLNGFYAPAAKLEALGFAPEDPAWDGYALDPDSSPYHTERWMALIRVDPTFGRVVEITPTLSLLRNVIDYAGTGDDSLHKIGHQTVGTAGVVVEVAGLRAHAEALVESVDGLGERRDRAYWMTGAAWTFTRDEVVWLPWVELRVNTSGARYAPEGHAEFFLAPAVQVGIAPHLDLTAEYVRWWMPGVGDRPFVDRVETVFTASF